MTNLSYAISTFWIFVLLVLSGCSTTSENMGVKAPDLQAQLDDALLINSALPDQTLVEMPQSLTDELLSLDSDSETPEARFDVIADNVEAQQFFKDLSIGTRLNLVVDPDLSGLINLQLKNVTLRETLKAIQDNYGLAYQETSYGYRIISNRIVTRIFTLDYLNVSRSGTSGTGISGSQISDQNSQSSQVNTSYDADFWSTLEGSLMAIIGDTPGRSIVVNGQTGVIVARGNPEELQAVAGYLENAESTLQRQVIIEARILEVSLQEGFRSGINWNSFANDLTGLTSDNGAFQLTGDTLLGVPDLGGIFNLGVNVDDFSALIQVLSNQGDVKVLSSPRISTVNNQKAVIKVGTDEYFVTNVTSGGDGDNAVPELTLQPFFSGIALDVTPQIGKSNDIILHVRPSVTDVDEKTKIINIGGKTYQLPLATSSIRETDSIIKASNGQIVIIGGLLQNSGDNQQSGVPGLSKIPGFKWLFSQQQRLNEKSELIILLQPRVTNSMIWQEEISAARERMGQ